MLILASGQSNASGRGNYGPSPQTIDSRVEVWNNQNDAGDVGTAFIASPGFNTDPWTRANVGVQNGDADKANNMFAWFADRAARELQEEVQLVLVSEGGLEISNWDPSGSDNMYARIVDNWTAAGLGEADVFLWHQGEADGGTTSTADYKTAFNELVSALRSNSILASDAPVIAGELIASDTTDINTAFSELADSDPLIYFASADGLNSYDGTHFAGASLYHFGRYRYWGEYRKHIGVSRALGDILDSI